MVQMQPEHIQIMVDTWECKTVRKDGCNLNNASDEIRLPFVCVCLNAELNFSPRQ
jgi:hypothetical protein